MTVDPYSHLVIDASDVLFKGIVCWWEERCRCVTLAGIVVIIIIIIMEAFIKRRIPGKTTCSKALQYNSNKVVIKLKLY